MMKSMKALSDNTPHMKQRRMITALCLSLCVAGSSFAADVQDNLSAVVAGPQRSAANQKRDVYRHPVETLQFFGLKPTQTVIEIEPGGGWYTEILAPYLRKQGLLYEAPYAGLKSSEELKESHGYTSFVQKLKQSPEVYDKVVVGPLLPGAFENIPTGSADMVVTFRNIHNWIKSEKLDSNLKAFYAALKPGGVFGVVDHRAKAGTSLEKMIETGYMSQDYVIEHAKAAGFTFVASSEINANPLDTADHPGGVWSLPPTLSGGDKDKAQFLAIGESDRMTLKFVKPK